MSVRNGLAVSKRSKFSSHWQTGVQKYAGAQVDGLDFMVVPYGKIDAAFAMQ